MAATGRGASKKAESSVFYGQENESYGADADDEGFAAGLATFERVREREETKDAREAEAKKREEDEKKKKEEEEYFRKKASGQLHVTGDKGGARGDEKKKEEKQRMKNEQLAKEEVEEKRLKAQERKKAASDRKKYMKSAEYKMEQFRELVAEGKSFMDDWGEVESAHQERLGIFNALKKSYDRQKKIDAKFGPKPEAKKAGGKPSGKKGGKKPDLSRFGSNIIAPKVDKKEDENLEMEDTDKDPNRPPAEKRAERDEFEKAEKAHKAYLLTWAAKKKEHNAAKELLEEKGCFKEEEEQEFEDDEESEDDSDEDDSDSESDDDWD